MSPVITGNAHSAVHDHGHISIKTVRVEEDPFERLERLRAAKSVRSPIRAPEGGWAGPEPVAKLPKTKKERKKRTKHVSSVNAERLADLAGQGLSANEIAAEINVSHVTVRRHAKDQGIALTPGAGGRTPRWDTDKAKAMALDGATVKEIVAAVGGASDETVRAWLRRRGIAWTPDRHQNSGRRVPDDVVARILAEYEAGVTKAQIAERTGWSISTVKRVIIGAGMPKRDERAGNSGGHNRHAPELDQQVLDAYAEHGSQVAVAALLRCSPNTVGRILHAHGVIVRTSAEQNRGRPGRDTLVDLRTLIDAHGLTWADVRTWGNANGHPVGMRGVPSREVIEACIKARS